MLEHSRLAFRSAIGKTMRMPSGLRRGEIQISEHDPRWLTQAAAICGQITTAAGDLLRDVQHVGSTSVPGLPAKPILDFALAVDDVTHVEALVARLTHLGYIDRGLKPGSIGHLLVYETAPEVRTQHLHIVNHGSEHWLHYIRFRDHLRTHSTDREALAALKRTLTQSNLPRPEYQKRKAEFVASLWARLSDQSESAPTR